MGWEQLDLFEGTEHAADSQSTARLAGQRLRGTQSELPGARPESCSCSQGVLDTSVQRGSNEREPA